MELMNPNIKRIWELVGLAFAIMFVVLLIVFRRELSGAPRVVDIGPAPEVKQEIMTNPSLTSLPPPEKEAVHASTIDYKGEKILPNNTEKLPEATRFESFSYDPAVGKEVNFTSTCNDVYYSVLIFSGLDDYKKNPGAAKVNNSFACPTNRIAVIKFNIADFNLPIGRYYVFIADQGKSGTWYNPR
ncbi:MAG: hypothetical protein WCV80_00685 [Candidatus Paceibacterota bacterium]|jgi:hypothetical protein